MRLGPLLQRRDRSPRRGRATAGSRRWCGRRPRRPAARPADSRSARLRAADVGEGPIDVDRPPTPSVVRQAERHAVEPPDALQHRRGVPSRGGRRRGGTPCSSEHRRAAPAIAPRRSRQRASVSAIGSSERSTSGSSETDRPPRPPARPRSSSPARRTAGGPARLDAGRRAEASLSCSAAATSAGRSAGSTCASMPIGARRAHAHPDRCGWPSARQAEPRAHRVVVDAAVARAAAASSAGSESIRAAAGSGLCGDEARPEHRQQLHRGDRMRRVEGRLPAGSRAADRASPSDASGDSCARPRPGPCAGPPGTGARPARGAR